MALSTLASNGSWLAVFLALYLVYSSRKPAGTAPGSVDIKLPPRKAGQLLVATDLPARGRHATDPPLLRVLLFSCQAGRQSRFASREFI